MFRWCDAEDKSSKQVPEHSSCGIILNREKKDLMKLNKALTTTVHGISEETSLMKRQTSKWKKTMNSY